MFTINNSAPPIDSARGLLASPSFFGLYFAEDGGWRSLYAAVVLSVFDHWLTEDECSELDSYFSGLADSRITAKPVELEVPYLSFYENLYAGERLVRVRQDQAFEVSSVEEARSIGLLGAREVEFIPVLALESLIHVLPLNDLTIIAAVPSGQDLSKVRKYARISGLYELEQAET